MTTICRDSTMKKALKGIVNKLKAADLPLLLLLAGVVNVKLYIKCATVLLYLLYIIYRKYPLKAPPRRILLFYLLMPATGITGALLQGSFGDPAYKFICVLAGGTWLLAGAVSWIVYLSVRQVEHKKLISTIELFFALNFTVSLGQLFLVMWSSHSLVPYWFTDAGQRYGVSTGDYIKGLSGNGSVTNGVIATLGVLFFYFRKNWLWTLVCLLTMILCTTNLTLLCFLLVLLIMLICLKERKERLRTFLLLGCSILIYGIVSLMNLVYIGNIFSKLFVPKARSSDSSLELYYKNHKKAFFYRNVSDSVYGNYASELNQLRLASNRDNSPRNSALSGAAINKAMRTWYGTKADETPLHFVKGPGKLYAFKQSFYYARSGIKNAFFGAGIGNFSSRIAIKGTGLGIEGSYPSSHIYASRDFFSYHLYTILYYFSLSESEHSVINMPDNTYDQLFSEYGLVGVLLFIFLYLGYFVKHSREGAYGRYLICLALLFFGYEYWFEMITMTVFFELFMFMDIFVPASNNGEPTNAHNGINAGL